jgi:hypothetical protein
MCSVSLFNFPQNLLIWFQILVQKLYYTESLIFLSLKGIVIIIWLCVYTSWWILGERGCWCGSVTMYVEHWSLFLMCLCDISIPNIQRPIEMEVHEDDFPLRIFNSVYLWCRAPWRTDEPSLRRRRSVRRNLFASSAVAPNPPPLSYQSRHQR